MTEQRTNNRDAGDNELKLPTSMRTELLTLSSLNPKEGVPISADADRSRRKFH